MCYSDVEEVVRRSQEPMYNVLMLDGTRKRVIEDSNGEENSNYNEVTGGTKKVRREFKEATNDDKLVTLKHRNFAPESKKK